MAAASTATPTAGDYCPDPDNLGRRLRTERRADVAGLLTGEAVPDVRSPGGLVASENGSISRLRLGPGLRGTRTST
jgi:hypothetical protein